MTLEDCVYAAGKLRDLGATSVKIGDFEVRFSRILPHGKPQPVRESTGDNERMRIEAFRRDELDGV